MKRSGVLLLFVVAVASAYTRHPVGTSNYEHRADNSDIHFLLNDQLKAGFTNSSGALMISPNSDIPAAANAAVATWSSLPGVNVHFAAVTTTSATSNSKDQQAVITFSQPSDALTSGSLAVTLVSYKTQDGSIVDSDIIFNSDHLFSTNFADGSYDFQAILTHELGHALGAGHSGVLGATMFQALGKQSADSRLLGPDDAAFAAETYGSAAAYGTLAGTLRDVSGTPLKGGLVTACSQATGITVGTLTSRTDGTYSFLLPPGDYEVWAEPLSGQVKSTSVGLSDDLVDLNFQPAVAGGFDAPSVFTISKGDTAQVDLSAARTSSTLSVTVAGVADSTGSALLHSGAADLPSGVNVYAALKMTGIGSDFNASNLKLVGPVQLSNDGSPVRVDPGVLWIKLYAPAVTAPTLASLLLSYNGNQATFSGGFRIGPQPPAFPVNGIANVFRPDNTSIAPGEIVSIYGTNLGPVPGVATSGFDDAGNLPASLGNVGITFDGIPAPLFFVSANQINAEVPYEIAGRLNTGIVVTYNGVASAAVSVPVAGALPGLAPHALNQDSTVNTAATPLPAGQFLFLYATGLGAKGADVLTGHSTGVSAAAASVTVTLNGSPVPAAYAGSAPNFTGLDQINLQIPPGTPSGAASLRISVGGQTSPSIQVWVR